MTFAVAPEYYPTTRQAGPSTVTFYSLRQMPSGQLFTEKMPGTIGEEPTERIIQQYLNQAARFESLIAQVAGQDMTWFFTQWKQGYPPDLDYRLADVTRNLPGASYKTAFTVEKFTVRSR